MVELFVVFNREMQKNSGRHDDPPPLIGGTRSCTGFTRARDDEIVLSLVVNNYRNEYTADATKM